MSRIIVAPSFLIASVGWIERENKVYPFALNFDITKDEDAGKRIPIGRECLKALGKL